MRASTLMVLASGWLCLSACAPRLAAPGTPQVFEQACDKPNEGQLISVEGYLRLPPALDSDKSVVLDLYPDLSFSGKPIGVLMLFGDGANQAHRISTSYSDGDLKVHLADGSVVPFRTHVRISGRMYFPAQPEDYGCALDHPYVEEVR